MDLPGWATINNDELLIDIYALFKATGLTKVSLTVDSSQADQVGIRVQESTGQLPTTKTLLKLGA